MSVLFASASRSLEEKISLVEDYANWELEYRKNRASAGGTITTCVAPRILERLRRRSYTRGYRLNMVISTTTGKPNEDRLLLLDILVEKLVTGMFAG